jgi:hypothetical protein
MKLNRIFASMLILAATATTSFAGVASLSWNSCTGPVNIAVPGGAPIHAYVSILGQNQTSQAYQCITIGGSPGGIQDAWRFDAIGCEGASFFTLDHTATALVVKTCPSFSGLISGLQIKRYDYDSSTGKVKIELASAYPNPDPNQVPQGNPLAVTPTQRYFLAGYTFDLTFATVGPTVPADGTCGGVGVPVCFALTSASWLDLAGNEIPYTFGQGFITSNDPNNSSGCPGAVPAATRTWGSVKNQYR